MEWKLKVLLTVTSFAPAASRFTTIDVVPVKVITAIYDRSDGGDMLSIVRQVVLGDRVRERPRRAREDAHAGRLPDRTRRDRGRRPQGGLLA